MKEIYENILDKEKIKKIGDVIHKTGGKRVMVDIYKLMKTIYHKMINKHDILEYYPRYFIYLIDQAWNEIDEWKQAK